MLTGYVGKPEILVGKSLMVHAIPFGKASENMGCILMQCNFFKIKWGLNSVTINISCTLAPKSTYTLIFESFKYIYPVL